MTNNLQRIKLIDGNTYNINFTVKSYIGLFTKVTGKGYNFIVNGKKLFGKNLYPIKSNDNYFYISKIIRIMPHNNILTRKEINDKISALKQQIAFLNSEVINLNRQSALLSDKKQQYKEEMETFVVSKRPKKSEQKLVGRIYWRECFMDQDTKEKIFITRSRIVKINGEWV